MLRKSHYVFVFIFALIKVDLVFSASDCESAYIEDSEEKEEPYVGGLLVTPTPLSRIRVNVANEKNTGQPTALKKPPKKRDASCFFLRKRKALKGGK